MSAFLDAALVFLVLLSSSALGFFIRPILSERHRSREVIDFVQLVVAMLVTFAAPVLGLLTSSVKGSFDKVGNQLRGLAIEIIQLDRSLREWGAETEPIRELLRTYTASAIATTWTEEPKPAGNYYPAVVPTNPASRLESSVLEDMLARIERGIRQLEPPIRCTAGCKALPLRSSSC